MSAAQNPLLSIIVPIVNEADELSSLLEGLTSQAGVSFELIVCDGGSCDEQSLAVEKMVSLSRLETKYIRATRGRGHQMNAGADIARGELLLFLHADSRFSSATAISAAVDEFRHKSAAIAKNLAGHFTLNFHRNQVSTSLAYFFYEAKTCLNRPDCIRGDQGFLLYRDFFNKMGRFDESLSFLEDVRLVDAIARQGEWISLPAVISTSARRFEVEGLLERQIANAIIINSVVTGWDEFFSALPGLYKCHPESGRLQLYPIFEGIQKLLSNYSLKRRATFWLKTGRHVAANIWQLFFWLDARAAFNSGLGPANVGRRWDTFYGKFIKSITSNKPFAVVTATSVWIWYRFMLLVKS